MNTAHVVKTLVNIDNSPIQDFTHPEDHIPPTYEVTLLVQLFYHSAFRWHIKLSNYTALEVLI